PSLPRGRRGAPPSPASANRPPTQGRRTPCATRPGSESPRHGPDRTAHPFRSPAAGGLLPGFRVRDRGPRVAPAGGASSSAPRGRPAGRGRAGGGAGRARRAGVGPGRAAVATRGRGQGAWGSSPVVLLRGRMTVGRFSSLAPGPPPRGRLSSGEKRR